MWPGSERFYDDPGHTGLGGEEGAPFPTDMKDHSMKNGDLSSQPVARIVVVFENGIGCLMDKDRPQWRKLSRRGKWDAVAALFELNHMMMRQIAWLSHKRSMSIDVVTYCGPQAFADALSRLFDREHLPVRIVFASTPARMARRTSFEPDIVGVYDANPEHALVYGSKGVVLSHHAQLGGS